MVVVVWAVTIGGQVQNTVGDRPRSLFSLSTSTLLTCAKRAGAVPGAGLLLHASGHERVADWAGAPAQPRPRTLSCSESANYDLKPRVRACVRASGGGSRLPAPRSLALTFSLALSLALSRSLALYLCSAFALPSLSIAQSALRVAEKHGIAANASSEERARAAEWRAALNSRGPCRGAMGGGALECARLAQPPMVKLNLFGIRP